MASVSSPSCRQAPLTLQRENRFNCCRAGRLANAMVAVLGPELRLGSRAYERCRALIREMAASGGAGGDEAAAGLERVLYAQQLALFAPHAAPAAAHLPLLLSTLRSRQPALRHAAAATLRHLAGRRSPPLGSRAKHVLQKSCRPLLLCK